MDRIHKIHLIERKATWWVHMVREGLTRKQTTSGPDDVWANMWKHMSDAAKHKAKQNWIIEKPKLDNARQSHAIFFIEPEDEELRHIIKNARRKLEVPMPAEMPCQTPVNCRGETCPQYWEKKDQICLYCRCWRIYENTFRRCTTKVSWISHQARNEGRRVHFASLMDLGQLKNSELKPKFQKYNGRVVLRDDIAKDVSGSCAVFAQQGLCASQMTAQKSWTLFQDFRECGRTSSRCNIRLYPGQNGRCTDVIENSKVRMSRYLDTSTTTQMSKIMVQYGRPSCSSWAKSVRSPFGRTIVGTAIWESSMNIRLGKSSKLGMFIC